MSKPEIELSPLAFSKIIDWTSTNTEREIGGYLIGKILIDSIILTDAVFATAESNPTYVSFDNMLQFRILEELEKKGKGEVICGWFHSHPGMTVFMSGTDIATQQIYQALLPEAIAMVNDGNTFARTRKQNDYKAKFFRVNNESKSYEVNFSIMTNPNDLVDILTDHIQDEENAERIAERAAQKMAISVENSLQKINANLVTKKEFELADTNWKKGLARTRKDIENMKDVFATKEDLNRYRSRHVQEAKFQRILSFIALGFSVITFILIIILLVKSFQG
ncbi:MAG TPA: Mov34/MPN/PAD-1 family protein [candidate division Zixibacteria bacterium]|nr:Mov34/MPN/PAD-1 family protein [candidate division Zixibacteria bacterium]